MPGAWQHARNTGIALRVAVGLNFCIGIALIAFGCSVQNPPTAAVPAMFVVVGCFNLFASIAGFAGSYNKKLMLLLFLVVASISLLMQICFDLAIFVRFDKVVNAIAPITKNVDGSGTTDPDSEAKNKRVAKNLNIGRWVMIGFIFVEVLTLVLAALLRYVIKEDVPYNSFDEENSEQRSLAITNLSAEVGKGRNMSEKTYDRVRAKMASKYGQFTHGMDWKAKIGRK